MSTEANPIVCKLLPTVGEACGQAAYKAGHPAGNAPPWADLDADLKGYWERVAAASVSTFLTERIIDVVNERWHEEAALGDLLRKGG